ncbi:MAG TPA: ATP-binding cassette domain-containing protein [Thermoplasmatales archaeon]|nr:MAG: daunorubicin ABC transporter ATP-binding protein [Thermoplasmata archaeon]RLF64238.1 MAG: daunorubicin ABC transporter ATP-binding protein [Thermoplasmata archaeon]HHF56085.1 ATP-binding cassette domain-containing protein [Thermoplasmatales archaeon]
MEYAVKTENLTKKFGEFTAVDGISLKVERGEVFGFLGPNGAGKTTTMRMLCTLTRPTSGTAIIAGFDLMKEPNKVREKIGLVSDKMIMYDRMTGWENIVFFARLHHLPEDIIKERTEKLLRALGMWEWRDEQIQNYSTGMRQRINVARALVNEPEILFLDEPLLGLDPQTSRVIREFIKDLSRKGITIILTTHVMEEVDKLCHRVGIIDHGKLINVETPDGLRRKIEKEDVYDIWFREEALPNFLHSIDAISRIEKMNGHIRIHGNSDMLDEVVRNCVKNGCHIQKMKPVEPTIEDVFIALTGDKIRDKIKR